VNDGGDNGASCVGIKVRTDTTKLSDMVIAIFGVSRNLIREGKMFIKDESKVASRLSGVKCVSSILSSCFLNPMSKNSVLEELTVRRLAVLTYLKPHLVHINVRFFCRNRHIPAYRNIRLNQKS